MYILSIWHTAYVASIYTCGSLEIIYLQPYASCIVHDERIKCMCHATDHFNNNNGNNNDDYTII